MPFCPTHFNFLDYLVRSYFFLYDLYEDKLKECM